MKTKTIKPLTEEQFLNFLKYVEDEDEVLAVEVFLAEINEGRTIKEVLAGEKKLEGVKFIGNPDPYVIKVKKESNNEYEIRFGCFPGPLVGDAGTWKVEFDDKNEVVSAVLTNDVVS